MEENSKPTESPNSTEFKDETPAYYAEWATIRMNPVTHKRMAYLAKYYKRSQTKQLEFLVEQEYRATLKSINGFIV